MAILTGINTNLRGSAGSWTFARLGGQTVAKQKVEKKDIPTRTMKQMKRRMQWGNLVSMWRGFSGNLHPSFEGKALKVSDFNEFMSANIGIVSVYLEKDEMRGGGCVVAPYQITRGSLPSIGITDGTGGVKRTDIELGSGFSITASTTVKALSDAIVSHNGGYSNGDQIAVFIARQMVNAATGVPYVVIEAEAFTLDQTDDETTVRSLVSAAGFSAIDDCLGASAAVNGGIAWVHSRSTQGGTKVSTQRLEVTNTLLAQYQTSVKLNSAIESYGGLNVDDFLTPKDSEGGEQPGPGPVPPSEFTLTLVLDPEDAGTYTVDGEHTEVGEHVYPAGTELQIHFDAASGWSFGGWKSGQTDPDITVTLDSDKEVEAIVLED